jgi:hypothetical protein
MFRPLQFSCFQVSPRVVCSDRCWVRCWEVPFREDYYLITPPPLPPDLWNHRVAAKTSKNLWAAITYGQNLERQGFSSVVVFAQSRPVWKKGKSGSRSDEHSEE